MEKTKNWWEVKLNISRATYFNESDDTSNQESFFGNEYDVFEHYIQKIRFEIKELTPETDPYGSKLRIKKKLTIEHSCFNIEISETHDARIGYYIHCLWISFICLEQDGTKDERKAKKILRWIKKALISTN